MAPRERRTETTRPALMNEGSARRLASAPPPSSGVEERRSDTPRPLPPAVAAALKVESPASMAKVSPETQAEAMKAAARTGTPFCEECGQGATA